MRTWGDMLVDSTIDAARLQGWQHMGRDRMHQWLREQPPPPPENPRAGDLAEQRQEERGWEEAEARMHRLDQQW